MKEDELDERTREALRGYRVPPAPPLDAMWQQIEERHFGPPVVSLADHARSRPERRRAFGSPSWSVLIASIAAALIIGVAVGRNVARDRASDCRQWP